MNDATSRFGRLLPLSPAAILMLTTPLLAACAPICGVVNSWSACHADIHGGDSSAVHSEIDEPPAVEHADAVERARPFVRALVVEENLPGLSLAVGMTGEVVWAEGFGWADIDERRPVTPKTLFRVGSVAKPMTATAVGLRLRDRLGMRPGMPDQRKPPGYGREWLLPEPAEARRRWRELVGPVPEPEDADDPNPDAEPLPF